MRTRISGIRTGLIVGFVGLIVVMIFIIQNAPAVNISFFGAHLHLSLAWRCSSPRSPALY